MSYAIFNWGINNIAIDAPNRAPSLVSDKVDVIISSLTPTNERAKAILYASKGLFLIVLENRDINSFADMEGKTIALTRGSVQDLYGTELFTDSEILRFDTVTDAYIAFKSGVMIYLLNAQP